jgi:hypothetical protein
MIAKKDFQINYYIVIIFLTFCGIFPFRIIFKTQGYLLDYIAIFIISVVLPYFFKQRYDFPPYFRKAIFLIIGIATFRFILDIGTKSTIETGPWKSQYIAGLLYLTYFVLHKYLHTFNMDRILKYFICVSSIVSVYFLLQIIFPFMIGDDYVKTRLFKEGGLPRFQAIYYRYAGLALILIFYFVASKKTIFWKYIPYGLLLFVNFLAVLFSGYRADLIILIATIACFTIFKLPKILNNGKILVFITAVPICFMAISYIEFRNSETVSDREGDTSINYRIVESITALDAVLQGKKWIVGMGYRDGIINPLAKKELSSAFYLHNGYLSIFYNYGMVGVVIWIYFIWKIIAIIFRNIKLAMKNDLFMIVSLFILGLLVTNMTNGIFNRDINVIFSLLLSMVIIEKISNSENANILKNAKKESVV